MNLSNATLKERLTNWTDWDRVQYEIGVCLGFWKDFGAPYDNDPWNNIKHLIYTTDVGNALSEFVDNLVLAGMLEMRTNPLQYRWNSNFKDLDIREV